MPTVLPPGGPGDGPFKRRQPQGPAAAGRRAPSPNR